MVAFELIEDEELLQVVRNRGPVIPVEIRNVLGKGDTITIGAALSSTVARGQVKITNVKRGGSPFYFIPGQEANLEKLGEFLNEKDRRTFHYLKEKEIIRDKEEEPLTRVSLRNMPDFAKKISRTIGDEEEIFWRWFLVSEEQASLLVNKKINLNFDVPKEKPKESKSESKIFEEQLVQTTSPIQYSVLKEERETGVQKEVKVTKKERVQKKIKPVIERQTSLPEEDDKEDDKLDFFEENSEEFLDGVKSFFDNNKFIVKSSKLIRKGSDYEFVVLMDTPVGKAEYFCKAKGKKRCNEGDLSQAYLQGQLQRIPVLFLTNGEVTNKSRDKLTSDFKGMLVKELL